MKILSLQKRAFLSLVFSLILLTVCAQTNCKDIPQRFNSYDEALTIIKKSTFPLSEKINTSKSSWIRGASYYSCDMKTGYFIIATDSKSYIHNNVPVDIWQKFKNAPSFGSFYNAYIKGNYALYLN